MSEERVLLVGLLQCATLPSSHTKNSLWGHRLALGQAAKRDERRIATLRMYIAYTYQISPGEKKVKSKTKIHVVYNFSSCLSCGFRGSSRNVQFYSGTTGCRALHIIIITSVLRSNIILTSSYIGLLFKRDEGIVIS